MKKTLLEYNLERTLNDIGLELGPRTCIKEFCSEGPEFYGFDYETKTTMTRESRLYKGIGFEYGINVDVSLANLKPELIDGIIGNRLFESEHLGVYYDLSIYQEIKRLRKKVREEERRYGNAFYGELHSKLEYFYDSTNLELYLTLEEQNNMLDITNFAKDDSLSNFTDNLLELFEEIETKYHKVHFDYRNINSLMEYIKKLKRSLIAKNKNI